jgi:hypothetical protein
MVKREASTERWLGRSHSRNSDVFSAMLDDVVVPPDGLVGMF